MCLQVLEFRIEKDENIGCDHTTGSMAAISEANDGETWRFSGEPYYMEALDDDRVTNLSNKYWEVSRFLVKECVMN